MPSIITIALVIVLIAVIVWLMIAVRTERAATIKEIQSRERHLQDGAAAEYVRFRRMIAVATRLNKSHQLAHGNEGAVKCAKLTVVDSNVGKTTFNVQGMHLTFAKGSDTLDVKIPMHTDKISVDVSTPLSNYDAERLDALAQAKYDSDIEVAKASNQPTT